MVWFNGGPGCSSLDGFFYEHGPFSINPSNYSQLQEREYRWNKIANTLYIEAPVGVGFSYSDTQSYKITDDTAASDNRAAIEAFYSMFPEYKSNKLFITGESYAGIYVPTLAEAIVQGQLDGSYTGAQLTGIAVGNGCSGDEIGMCGTGTQGTYYQWTYLVSTGFVEQDLKKQIMDECDWEAAKADEKGALSLQCTSLLNQASAQIQNINLYNIYGDCVSDMGCNNEMGFKSKVPVRENYVVEEGGKRETLVQGRVIPHGPDACIDSAAASGYLNQESVMEAIHVVNPGFCWSVCQTAKGWSYKSTRPNLPRDTYPLLIQNIDVTIYNGDWDACVPYTDNEGWTEGMGFPTKNPWHKWDYTSTSGADHQVGGYAVSYDVTSLGSNHLFEFITVRGGRHEVPESAPAQGLEMLNRIITSTPF